MGDRPVLGPTPTVPADSLAIDAHRLLGHRAGVARYLSALLREWARVELPFRRVVLITPRPLPPEALPDPHPFLQHVVPSLLGPVWHQWSLARAARGCGVLFCPSYVAPLVHRGLTVVTTHDVLHELFPRTFPWYTRYRPWLNRYSARRASAVITDSEASRRDVIRLYGLPPARVHAIPLAADGSLGQALAPDEADVRLRHRLGDSFLVLFVGKFSYRRNLPLLVRAFARARRRLPPAALLVLVGDDHGDGPLARLAADLGLGDALRLLGHVSDDDLGALYRAAELFIYLSHYEGFGLPPLEAMAAGTPVIALDNSALREVVGDAGVLLPRPDETEIAEAIVRLALDPQRRARLAEAGRRRAAEYSWSETARRTMEILARVAGLGR
jgi:glycosyltransferase involved in cell wall biosynthesis